MQTSTVVVTPPTQREKRRNPRGVYEKAPGSGEWWIRYVDAQGRYRREKAGTKSNAIDLVRKRKTEALQGKKLPEKLRRATVTFVDISTDSSLTRRRTRSLTMMTFNGWSECAAGSGTVRRIR
jgi:hypothetical protein